MSLEEAQGSASVDRIHKMVAWSKHCLGSEKREGRLRHMEIGNYWLLNFKTILMSLGKRFCSTVRVTDKSLWSFTEFALENLSYIDGYIKYRTYFQKPKRTKWDFLETTTTLNTWVCTFWLCKVIVVQAWMMKW